jgi:3',5'-cyclic-nucleotide phosphodiesterase
MRLKVLGAYGAADASHNLTGYLIDDRIAVDAGTLTSKITLAQQARIETVVISHAHADHIRDLPHLIVNRFHMNAPPINLVTSNEVMEVLARHVFNGDVWPDFEKIFSPDSGKPPVQYRPLANGRRTRIGDVFYTVVPVAHSVPACGAVVEFGEQSIVFTGDTTTTEQIWKRANKVENLVAIVSEASFPNDFRSLAIDSGHMTPEMFEKELSKVDKDVPVYASHRKIPFDRKIESEIRNIRDRRARILVEKQYTF